MDGRSESSGITSATDNEEGHRGDTRSKLVRAALDIIEAHGIDALRIDDVAADVGVTKGSLYWHFADREALIHAALAQHIADSLEAAYASTYDAVTPADGKIDYLARVAPHIVDPYDAEAMDRRWRRLEMLCAIRRDPELWQRAQEMHASSLERFTDLMVEVQSKGLMRPDVDPKSVAVAIQAIGMGSIWIDIVGADAPDPGSWHMMMMFLIQSLFPND